jgi:hypothetical protein
MASSFPDLGGLGSMVREQDGLHLALLRDWTSLLERVDIKKYKALDNCSMESK